ncbi:Baculoviral IAP repeat-containing protein 5.1 [Liparis tanakae]|uniref:Baculoviral IAP repeat-containing protein 5.1 n=1 Tax=Liparis tanakae TaxID=230148 RepID=A0A4Z2FCV2_9TELE|nr:Baculoviral IAP repeat-containing protein 5.1 [Liparis tanakae]
MYIYENRLKTFEGWPFDEGCSCTPENMAKAGFVHTPSGNSPDVAMCFFCLKELEGWEPEDDPQLVKQDFVVVSLSSLVDEGSGCSSLRRLVGLRWKLVRRGGFALGTEADL